MELKNLQAGYSINQHDSVKHTYQSDKYIPQMALAIIVF